MTNPRIILQGTNDTRKKSVTVYTLDSEAKPPYQGKILIEPVTVERAGNVLNTVLFTPDPTGHYYYFSLSQCNAVDGARVYAIVRLGDSHALTIMELHTHAQIKKRNLLSRCIDLITFHNGVQISSEEFYGKTPSTINSDILPSPSTILINKIDDHLNKSTF